MHTFYKKITLLSLAFSCFFAQAQLFIGSGGVVSNNALSISITGDVRLANNSTLVNNGLIIVNHGDWLDQTLNSYPYGNGQMQFVSADAQAINSLNTWNLLQFNGPNFQLKSNVQTTRLRILNGTINTGAFSAIVTGTQDNDLQFDNASWFIGKLRRYIDPASVAQYQFPVSNNQNQKVVTLTSLQAHPLNNVTYVDAAFTTKPGNDAGLLVSEGAAYVSVNPQGVWIITPDVAPTSGQYNLLLSLNGFTGLNDNDFGILQRPAGSANAADWTVPAGSTINSPNTVGRTVAGGIAQRNGMTSFGQFGIGMSTSALPVTIASFNATRIGRAVVKLDWQTATEQNNKGFGIERRYDYDSTFAAQGFVASQTPGGNSSSLLSYSYNDPNGYQGVSYYRLKQTDLDGHEFYTLIKAVKGTGDNSVTVLLWPNPSKGQFSIRVNGNTRQLPVLITDISGNIVKRATIQQNQDITISGLASGTYIIRIPGVFGEGEGFSEKVLVIK